ncbi:hypothetical protein HOG07_05130 [Candidatus Woesearchaeota archaeon]|nr:hypothetical protein [Candidatus Woesearchaeota archaeon]
MYLKRGAKRTCQVIRKNKLLFMSLIILQIIFIGTMAYTGYSYQIKILESAKGVMDPLEDANYDPENIKAGGEFTGDALAIYRSYKDMRTNVLNMVAWMLGIFVIINGLLWAITHRMFKKVNLKSFGNQLLKFFVSSLVFLVPYIIISYSLLKGLLKADMAIEAVSSAVRIVTYTFMAFYYFMIVALAFIDVKSWKEFVKVWVKVGIKNFPKALMFFLFWPFILIVLLIATLYKHIAKKTESKYQKVYNFLISLINTPSTVLLINLMLFSASIYFLSINVDETTFGLMILFSVILVIVVVLTRIFWIASLKEI